MRFPTFAQLTQERYVQVEYDHQRALRYVWHDSLLVWEDGLVDLAETFEGDPSGRSRWGERFGLSVCASDALPTQRYRFVAPDGYEVKKADLYSDGVQHLLIDWQGGVATAAQWGRNICDSRRNRVARWVHPNALPVPARQLTYRTANPEKAREVRAYAKALAAAANAILRFRASEPMRGNPVPRTTLNHLLDTRPPVEQVLCQFKTLAALQSIASACSAPRLVQAAVDRTRIARTCTYLRVVPK